MALSPEDYGPPDEGEALPDNFKVEMPPRKTGGELMAGAADALLGGIGGAALAQ